MNLLTLPNTEIPILTPEESNKRLDELLAMPKSEVALYIPELPGVRQPVQSVIMGILTRKSTVKAIAIICNHDDSVLSVETLERMAKHIDEIRKAFKRQDVRVDIFTVPQKDYDEIREM